MEVVVDALAVHKTRYGQKLFPFAERDFFSGLVVEQALILGYTGLHVLV